MGRRKLRFDVRKNCEKKKRVTSVSRAGEELRLLLRGAAMEILLLSVHRNPINLFQNDRKLKKIYSFIYYTQHLYSNI